MAESDMKIPVESRVFTSEALVIVALMRKLEVTEVKVKDLDLSMPKGLVLSTSEVTLIEATPTKEED